MVSIKEMISSSVISVNRLSVISNSIGDREATSLKYSIGRSTARDANCLVAELLKVFCERFKKRGAKSVAHALPAAAALWLTFFK